jgi:cytochrome bd-type quinol oxidase subunit 1
MKNSVANFVKELGENENLKEEFIKNPMDTIKKFENSKPTYFNDVWIYRIVVGVLGMVIFATTLGVIFIMMKPNADIDNQVPTLLTATCSAALGALTGLLVPSPTNN